MKPSCSKPGALLTDGALSQLDQRVAESSARPLPPSSLTKRRPYTDRFASLVAQQNDFPMFILACCMLNTKVVDRNV